MIRKSNQDRLKSGLNPSATAVVNISAEDYILSLLDNQDTANKPNPSIKFTSIDLQEMIKLDITSKLSGDLGFLVYTQGGFGLTSFTPRITYNLWNGYSVQMSKQIGDKQSFTFGFTKTFSKS